MSHNNTKRNAIKLVTLVFVAIAACIAIPQVVKRFQPTQYEAKVWIQISKDRVTLLDEPKYDPEEFERFRAEQIALLRSPLVIRKVMQNKSVRPVLNQLSDDPNAFLLENLETIVQGEEMLIVRMTGPEDQIEQRAAILEAVIEAFFNCSSYMVNSRQHEVVSLLSDERQEVEKVLRNLDDKRRDLNERYELDKEQSDNATRRPLELDFIEQDIETASALRGRLRARAMQLDAEKMAPARVTRASEVIVEPLK